jgi:Short C-terminal domain/Phospholipase_D-nuclease N-terminal
MRIATLPRMSSRWSVAVLAAGASLLLSACNQVGSATITFWDVIWSMIFFFFWFMAIWIFIQIFADIFRRDDLSGGMKALWTIVLIFLPFLGALIYLITRPKVTAQDVQLLAKAEAAQAAVSDVSTADELAKLQQLRAAGAISDAEFESLKAKLLS